jgi:hypothetical protein
MSENEVWVIYHVDKEKYYSRTQNYYYGGTFAQISSVQNNVNYTNNPSEISYYSSLEDAVYAMKSNLINENEVIIVPAALKLTPDFSRAAQKENIEEMSILDPKVTTIETLGSYSHKTDFNNSVTITDEMLDSDTIAAGSISIAPVPEASENKTILNKLRKRFSKK